MAALVSAIALASLFSSAHGRAHDVVRPHVGHHSKLKLLSAVRRQTHAPRAFPVSTSRDETELVSESSLSLDGQQSRAPEPAFSWRLVFFFAANPLALLPFAAVPSFLGLGVGGAAFALTRAALLAGAIMAVPLMAITNLPLERIPALRCLEEVNSVSQFLAYLLFGARKGLRQFAQVVSASLLIGTAAGVAEELVFRGTIQGGIAVLLKRACVPSGLCHAISIACSSFLFGVLHSYSSSPAYAIAAFVASVYFGSLFTLTGNIVVPIVAHLVVDLVALVMSYLLIVYKKSDAERAELWACDQPIARTLRQVAGYQTPMQG